MSSPQLKVDLSRDGDAAVVHARGELDMATAMSLATALNGLVGEGDGAVVVDLSGLRFMDSTGMSVLLNAQRRLARQGRALSVVCPPGPVLRVFGLTNMVDTLNVRETRSGGAAQ